MFHKCFIKKINNNSDAKVRQKNVFGKTNERQYPLFCSAGIVCLAFISLLCQLGGEVVKAGNIIVRQRGTVHNPDKNVGMGKDHTLYALCDGTVKFTRKREDKSYVSVIPFEN